jgi:DNA (cytosine-5)-methyltransferase 1
VVYEGDAAEFGRDEKRLRELAGASAEKWDMEGAAYGGGEIFGVKNQLPSRQIRIGGMDSFTFYEFFCGGGMARAGLGESWSCLFANDFDAKKAASYARNWGADGLLVKDVREIEAAEIPGRADLAWASFPCQDLSLAGMGAGLDGERSGAFWPFWRLMRRLREQDRAPALIVLENVCGALTSHGGADFRALAEALGGEDFRFGALVVDALDFVPQSRPRLFVVAASAGVETASEIVSREPSSKWHTPALRAAHLSLTADAKRHWLWWRLPEPPRRHNGLRDLVEETPTDAHWRSYEETRSLLRLMSEVNLAKVRAARAESRRLVGAMYRRTRSASGGKVQRAEVRFDDVAGCLRTPAGGSSRQSQVVVDGETVRSRLLSGREAARLMGLPDDYILPTRYNDAYHLVGDGVAPPVVRHLARRLPEPILRGSSLPVLMARG